MSCLLANISQRLGGRSLRWDAETHRVIGDEEANRFLIRPYREPWIHPTPDNARPLHLPSGHHSVTPYLLTADVGKLLGFILEAFDAETTERVEMPDGTVSHAEVQTGDSRIMLGQARDECRYRRCCIFTCRTVTSPTRESPPGRKR